MFDVLLLPLLILIAGFALLAWSADHFVNGAAALASNLGISPLIIGLTVIGLGTSAPEMIVAALSSLQDKPQMAMGNALGSNITNIALILGVTALVAPIAVNKAIIKKEFLVLLVVSVLASGLLLDRYLSIVDGIILVISLIVVLFVIKHFNKANAAAPNELGIDKVMPLTKAVALTLISVLIMLGSSHFIVESAVDIARYFGVSDLIIGLTIIAIGTSLPELAASLAAVKKHAQDLAIGNVIGSNMFNLLAVLAMPALIEPARVPPEVLHRDLPIMLGLTVALYLMSMNFNSQKNGVINRSKALVLVGCYIAYGTYLYLTIA